MATVEKRSVALSSELAAAVDEAVARGEYGNASEVIREALRQWKERRELRGYTVDELRRAWRDGLESGSARPLTDALFDEVRAKALQRLEAASRKA